jgi:N-acetylmuramoyl-L-alanine amidase
MPLAEGRARGATLYTLSETASDAASAALAEQHDRADMLQGVDLSASDDVVAGVLMDLARVETAPRADALADGLVAASARRACGCIAARAARRASPCCALPTSPRCCWRSASCPNPGISRTSSIPTGGRDAGRHRRRRPRLGRDDAMRATLLRQ